MAHWQQGSDTAILLDLSPAGNSAQACQLLDEFVSTLTSAHAGTSIDINAGDLLLTRGVLMKMKQQIIRNGAVLGIMYATLPQTQQSALDEGLFVKEKPSSLLPFPIRQPLPGNQAASRPASPSLPGELPRFVGGGEQANATIGVELPFFSSGQGRSNQQTINIESIPPNRDTGRNGFTAVAPQSTHIPELGAVTLEPEYGSVATESSEPLSELLNAFAEEEVVSAVAEPEMDESVVSAVFSEKSTAQDGEVGQVSPDVPLPESLPNSGFETLYWRQTLRSGQTLRFQGNIVIIGDVHAGSEITAGGDIVVWGELRGLAHAGAKGNYKSEIRAMRIEALQLRIAEYIGRRPDRIYYHKEELDTVVSPEVARVADGEIKIFKSRTTRF